MISFARRSAGSGTRSTYPSPARSSTSSPIACGVIAARSARWVSRLPSRSMLTNTAEWAARIGWPAATTPPRMRSLRTLCARPSR